MRFEQQVLTKDVDIYGLAENEELIYAFFRVEWDFDIEYRSWGVKGCYSNLVNIQGEYVTVKYSEDGGDSDEVTYQFDFAEYRNNAKMEITWSAYNQLTVSALEIDLTNKTVTVS